MPNSKDTKDNTKGLKKVICHNIINEINNNCLFLFFLSVIIKLIIVLFICRHQQARITVIRQLQHKIAPIIVLKKVF